MGKWKKKNDYHRRSRSFENQKTDLLIRFAYRQAK